MGDCSATSPSFPLALPPKNAQESDNNETQILPDLAGDRKIDVDSPVSVDRAFSLSENTLIIFSETLALRIETSIIML
jgi:hypothetical protein